MNKRASILTALLTFVVLSNALVVDINATRDKLDTHVYPSDPTQYCTPENETAMADHVVTFGWCSIKDSKKYFLQVSNEPDLKSSTIETYTVEAQSTVKDRLPDGKYYWRVKAFKSNNESVWLWSGTASFTIFTPKVQAIGTAKDLGIVPKQQRKDTKMLCLESCGLSGNHSWDSPHQTRGCEHDNMYCARAGISMMNSYYGGNLSQDRISYYVLGEENGSSIPEVHLGHGRGLYDPEIKDALSWALGGVGITNLTDKPSFDEIREWIDNNRPILRAYVGPGGSGHTTVIDGYDTVNQLVHVIDPWDGTERSIEYSSLGIFAVWVPPASGVNARSDELQVGLDSDADGIVDFDEMSRVHTNPNTADSDGDGVKDKEEVRCYTFLSDGSFDLSDQRKPDPDNDTLRAELDSDSDNGGAPDGLEDLNGNGKVDTGETDPLVENDDKAVDLSVVSVQPMNSTSIFQVYHNGMWLNGARITLDYSVTVRRVDDHAQIGIAGATVSLNRTNADNSSDYRVIATSSEFLLTCGMTQSLVLTWNETNTMRAGNWTISAFINSTSYFDYNLANNKLADGTVQAKELVGDVNGDGIVDVFDAIRVAMAFNSHLGEPRWDPDADFNKDGVVDIYDCILLAIHFGENITGPTSPKSGTSVESVATGPAISVDPSQLVVFKGEVFTVSVKITDVVDLRGWEFKLYWNKTVLNCTSVTVQTPAEWQNNTQSYAPGLEANYNTTHARFWKAQSADYPAPSFNGSMTIVTLTFQAMQPGTTGLTMADAKLGNSTAQPITCIVSSGSVSVHYGRYMRSDTHTINGLNAYRLGIPQSASSAVYSKSGSGEGASWGTRAWVRHSNGVEQEISLDGQTGTPKALVYRYSGSGIQSNTVSVTQTALQSTDSLVVRVYVQIAEGSWNLCATFTTEQLQSTTLTGTTWTVYYYTYAYYSYKYDTTSTKFYWGTTTYNSRIQNLRYI